MEKNANRADPWTMLLDAVLVPVCFAAGVTGGGWALKALGCQDDAATFLIELALALVCFLLFRRVVLRGERRPLSAARLLFCLLCLGAPFLADGAIAIIGAPLKSVPSEILFAALAGLAVGIAEETVFRGVVFNRLREGLDGRRHGLILSALLSSAVFGLLHLLNLTTQPLVTTLMQMYYAFAAGVGFCGIYVLSGTLLLPILLHAIVDVCHFLPAADCAAPAASFDPVLFGLSTLLLCEGVAALLVYRRKTANGA